MALASLEGGARLIAELKNYSNKRPSGAVDAGYFDAESATVAFYNEYGTATAPPRPFMFITINTRGKSWADGLRARLAEGMTVKEALTQTGRDMASDILMAVSNPMMYPTNAKATIKKKGFNAPLLETGEILRGRVKFKVRRSASGGGFGSLT